MVYYNLDHIEYLTIGKVQKLSSPHMWFVIFKSVSFRILQSGINFNFINVSLSFNTV
jgi:hypothetical protein